jgi:TolB-like protein
LTAAIAGISFGKDVVSVLYFDNTTGNKSFEWLRKAIADMLITDISESSEIEVVERENMQKIIEEQKLSLAGLVDEDQAIKIGQMLNAKKMIYGAFIISGNNVRIDGKITDTETGKILATFSSSGIVKNILGLQNELAGKALTAMGIKKPPVLSIPQAYAFEAVKTYYEGLDLLDKGIADEALKKFQEASKYDPSYLKPYAGIEESYKFLKDFKMMRYQKEINDLYYKIHQMEVRLNDSKWMTFGDLVMNSDYMQLSKKDSDAAFKKYYAYYQGDTPAQLTWNLQNAVMELGGLYEEYFGDTNKEAALYQEVINISDKSAPKFKKDKFLPEILYQKLLALTYLKRWAEVKTLCEDLMVNFSDYRMMWAVESMYERALEALKKKK